MSLPLSQFFAFSLFAIVAAPSLGTDRPPVPTSSGTHWAFVAPKVTGAARSIDLLIDQKRGAAGLIGQPAAPPPIWLRRVFLDLTGLPPSALEMQTFQKEAAIDLQGARRRAVDRLLASPQYGERWGRHFMDIWRYADWYGLGSQLRNSQKHLWHWRDWIIESLNADKGYDRMITEMLAGDEIAPQDPDVLRATGFLARNYYLFNRTTWLDDVIEHTSKAFLGLTMNCVKCHAHKYDPFTHEDYYAMRAIFEPYHVRLDALPGQPDLEKDGLPRAYDLHLQQATYLHIKGDDKNQDTSAAIAPAIPAALAFKALQIAPVRLPALAAKPESQKFVKADQIAAARKEVQAALATAQKSGATDVAKLKLAVAQSKLRAIQRQDVASFLAYEVAKAKLAVTEAKLDQKAAAEKALSEALANQKKGTGKPYRIIASLKALEGPDETDETRYQPFPKSSTGRRTALAAWITDRQNPLTARVLVNHVWLRHFGQPLVADVVDFGLRSPAPGHQALLDWLAVEFMESGWSLKHLHRIMVLSETYGMTSSGAGAPSINAERDPENKFYWRMNPIRLDAQTLRDSLLQLSGRLDLTFGGPPLSDSGEDKLLRRSLYLTHSRDNAAAFLNTFDNANILECYRRAESIVPQQALALMNGGITLAAAETIAKSLPADNRQFIQAAFELILATAPSEEEITACLEAFPTLGDPPTARTAIIHTLLNHNDFITVR